MQADTIPWLNFAGFFAVLVIPLVLFRFYGLGLSKALLIAATRMTVQLLLVAVYLQTIFGIDNPWLNIGWFMVMVAVTAWTGVARTAIPRRPFLLPLGVAVLLGSVPVLLLTIVVLANPSPWYQAQFLIPLGGMLLGNALKGIIVGLERYFSLMRDKQQLYLQHVSLGASRREATAPILRQAMQASLAPAIGSMATVGVVALPGMMTGQILAGAEPITAIQYQIGILIAIFVTEVTTVAIALELCTQALLDDWQLPIARYLQ